VAFQDDLNTVESVLFDLDGTLIDSKEMAGIVLDHLFMEYRGVQGSAAQKASFRGKTTRQIMAQIDPERIEEILQVCGQMENDLRYKSRLYPGIPEALAHLYESGIRMGVVSSQARIEMEGLRRHFDLDKYIQVWVCADDVDNPKPAADAVLLALDSLQTPAHHTVMVGDSWYDMQAGRQAGTLLGAALWDVADHQDMLSLNPHMLFHHPEDLKSLCH